MAPKKLPAASKYCISSEAFLLFHFRVMTSEKLSPEALRMNQIVRCVASRSAATKYSQGKGDVSVVEERWVFPRKFEETLRLRGDHWMMALTLNELEDQGLR
jgi:hypothetical protein